MIEMMPFRLHNAKDAFSLSQRERAARAARETGEGLRQLGLLNPFFLNWNLRNPSPAAARAAAPSPRGRGNRGTRIKVAGLSALGLVLLAATPAGAVGTADGYVPIGTATVPTSIFGVYGNASIGASYIGTAAPANGLIIQGVVGIGTNNPVNTLDVTGTGIHIAAGTPGTPTYDLYNVGGVLYWNGSPIGAATITGAQYQMAYFSALNTVSGDANITTDASNDLLVPVGSVGIGTTGPTAGLDIYTNGAASTAAEKLDGTWYTSGGTATTTKPQLLIEPAGTVSTGWNTSGTGLGINAPSGFAGNLIDAQVNGSDVFYVSPSVFGLGVSGGFGIGLAGSGSISGGWGIVQANQGAQNWNTCFVAKAADGTISLKVECNNSTAGISRVGLSQGSPVSTLDVNGGVTVGGGYSGVNTAPTNGMIVQGNVGIGTTAPTRTLDVVADGINNANGSFSQISVRGTASATHKLNIGYNTSSHAGFIEAVNENTLWENLALQPGSGSVGIGFLPAAGFTGGTLAVAGSAVFGSGWAGSVTPPANSFLVQGNVGIGSTSPAYALDVGGSIAIANNGGGSTNRLYLASGSPAGNIYATTGGGGANQTYFEQYGGNWTFQDSSIPSPVMTLKGGTIDLGFGWMNSASITTFTQAVTNAGYLINEYATCCGNTVYWPGMFWTSTGGTKPAAGIFVKYHDSVGSTILMGTSNNISTGMTNTALAIDPSGNVGIGSTTPVAALDVEASSTWGVYGNNGNSGGIGVYGNTSSSTGYGGYFTNSGGGVGLGVATGGIYLGSSTPGTTSYALYNVGGTLYWNGSAVGAGSGSVGSQYQMAYFSAANTVSGDANITTDASNDLLIPSGKVGVGTTGPAAQLDVRQAAAGGTNPGALAYFYGSQYNSGNPLLSSKVVIESANNSYGQLQIGNPNNKEVSTAYISNVTAFGNPTSSGGNAFVWLQGSGLFSSLGSQYSIANKNYGGPIFAVDAAGGVSIGAYSGNVQTVAPPANGLIVSGNVGIGTATPADPLHVNSTAAEQMRVGYDAADYSALSVDSGGNTTLSANGHGGATQLTLQAQNNEVNINNSGCKFSIYPLNGSTTFDTYTGCGGTGAGEYYFRTAGYNLRMTISGSTGYVGIGTATPGAALDVENNASPQVIVGGSGNATLQLNPGSGYGGSAGINFANSHNGFGMDGYLNGYSLVSDPADSAYPANSKTLLNLSWNFGGNQTTNGESNLLLLGSYSGFVPSSGNATYEAIKDASIIAQTGTANGITRGLYISPQITNTYDYRGIETAPYTDTLLGTPPTTLQQVLFNAPTLAAGGSTTVTNAATQVISGAPIAGSNVSITNSYGLMVLGTTSVASGTTNAYGLSVAAPTGATNDYAAVFNGGNVGIGTTSPGQALVVGNSNQFTVSSTGAMTSATATIGAATIVPVVVSCPGCTSSNGNPTGTYVYVGQYNGANYYKSAANLYVWLDGGSGSYNWMISGGTGNVSGSWFFYTYGYTATPPYGSGWTPYGGASGALTTSAGVASNLVVDTSGDITTGGVLAVQGSGNSSFVGNVGIGTTGPVDPLQIFSSAGEQMRISYDAGDYGALSVDNYGELNLTAYSAAGNAGIIMNVQGEIWFRGYCSTLTVYPFNGGVTFDTYTPCGGNGDYTFRTAGYNTRMTISGASGYVGIGTATPANTLDVTGTGIHIASSTAPSPATYNLYNVGGVLYWNGSPVGAGGGGAVGSQYQMAYFSAANTVSGNANITTDATGDFTIAPTAVTSGAVAKVTYTQPADTGLTASTNAIIENWNNAAATRTHATGALTLQSDFVINGTTDAFAGASTLANGATLALNYKGCGSNASCTNESALYIPTQALTGTTQTTNSYGLNVAAATGATNNYAAVFNGGNVGIGTTAPGALLDVYSSAGIGAIDFGGVNGISVPASDATSIAIGSSALAAQTVSGSYNNTAVGYQALGGALTSAATQNTAVGYQALSTVTSGTQNTALGIWAGNGITSGAGNTFVGYAAAGSGGYVLANTAIGAGAFQYGGGSYNSAVGHKALKVATGSSNVGVGNEAGVNITSGSNNIAIGWAATNTLTSGSGNILIGGAIDADTPASNTNNFLNIGNVLFATGMTGTLAAPAGSVGIGTASPNQTLDMKAGGTYGYNGQILAQAQTTLNNWFFGGAGNLTATGGDNYALGSGALANIAGGWTNIAMGSDALQATDYGSSNIGIGKYAIRNASSGGSGQNVGVGEGDFYDLSSGSYNTAIGYNTGRGIGTGSGNTIIGANVTGLASGLANNIILANGTGAIKAQNDGTNWNFAGSVGIGTASPGALLQVGNGNNSYAMFNLNNGASPLATPPIGGGLAIGDNYTDGGGEVDFWNLYTYAGTAFTFNQMTNVGTFRNLMTMSSSGSVGIGTTGPVAQLDVEASSTWGVYGNNGNSGGVGVYGNASSSTGYGGYFTNSGTGFGLGVTNGIYLSPSTPGSTANALYNIGGTLYWNGSTLGGTTSSSGSGTAGYEARWTSSTALATGTLSDNGSQIGLGTASPTGLLNVVAGSYTSNQVMIQNGVSGSVPSYVGSYQPTLSIQDSEVSGSRPLWFGYTASGVWGNFITMGDCGAWTQMCFDMGYGSSIYTALTQNGTTLAVGGPTNAGTAVDGAFNEVDFGNTGKVYFNTPSIVEIGGSTVFNVDTGTIGGRFVVTAAGKVGIGNATPGGALDVESTYPIILGGWTGAGNVIVGNSLAIGTQSPLGSTVLEVESTNQIVLGGWPGAGGVAIGTTSAQYALDIYGGFFHTTDNTQSYPASTVNGGLAVGWNYSNTSAEVNLYNVYNNAPTAFQFSQKTGNSTSANLMTIMGNGKVGIGTTGPTNMLDVNGSVAVGTYAGTATGASNELIVGGSVGIGTTGPSYPLHIVATTNGTLEVDSNNATGTGIGINNTSTGGHNMSFFSTGSSNHPGQFGVWDNTSSLALMALNGVNGGAAFGSYAQSGLAVSTPNQGIIVSGSVGIGTTGPANALDVNGSVAVGTYAGTATGASNELIVGGSVGIGTTSPGALLDVGSSGTTQGVMRLESSAASGRYVGLQPSASTSAAWTMTLPAAAPTAVGQALTATNTSGTTAWVAPANVQLTSASPAAPTATSPYKMQGLGATITPTKSGNILVIISGTIGTTSTTAAAGIQYQLSYGTGTAPANAAALTGTQVGQVQKYTNPATATAIADVAVPFTTQAVITGLAVGTTYWIDLAAETVGIANSGKLTNVSVSAIEQ